MAPPERVFGQTLAAAGLRGRPTVVLGGRRDDDGIPGYRAAQLSRDLAEEFGEMVRRSLGNWNSDYEEGDLVLQPYDPGYRPESHEVVWLRHAEHPELTRFLGSIPEVADAEVFEEDDPFLDEIRFFVVTAVIDGGVRVRLFRTLAPSKKLTRSKGIVAHLVGRRFEKIEDVSLVFEPGFQVVAVGDYMFVFSLHAYETLFQFYGELRATAEAALEEIGELVPIANFDEFREDAVAHVNKIRKLRNIMRSSYVRELDMERLKATIREFGLPVRVVTEDGQEKLAYDPSEPWALLQLLEDQFVNSPTTGRKYAANSKREVRGPARGR